MSQEKQGWSHEAGYVWSLIGSAVGFANVLSFSALCYKNGGGAFLVPYILAHLLIGIPMLLLESLIGQKHALPLVSAFGHGFALGKSKRLAKTLGWLSVLTCASIGGFYIVLTGFSVAYTYFSSSGQIPMNTASFFKQAFLKDSGSLQELGGIAWSVLICTTVVALMTWAVLTRNIRAGVEKLCTLFLPMLGLLMFAFAIFSFFLPGSLIGIKNYLIPDFSKLCSFSLWRDVFGQVFFSLSLGLGIVTGYSRHNGQRFNLYRSMVKVAIGDFVISFISGLAIFGCMGFMSQKSQLPFSELISSDSAFEIGFVIFPMIMAQFGLLSQILGPLFFFCIFIAGITGVFSIVESVAGNIEIEFNKTRKEAVLWAMMLVFSLALPFCLGNGQHLLGALAPMLLGDAMLIGGIVEIMIFLFLIKFPKEIWLSKKGKFIYPFYALKYVVFPLLILSLGGALFSEFSHLFSASQQMLESGLRWAWFGLALLCAYALSQRTTVFVRSKSI